MFLFPLRSPKGVIVDEYVGGTLLKRIVGRLEQTLGEIAKTYQDQKKGIGEWRPQLSYIQDEIRE